MGTPVMREERVEIVAGSVLLVDDEPAVLAAIRRTLRVLRVKVRVASSAEEGLALVEVEHPNLVISDFQMGGMDGLAFLALVKQRYPQIACVLHTGTTPIPSRFGVDIPVLAKPCESGLLVELVRSLACARNGEPLPVFGSRET